MCLPEELNLDQSERSPKSEGQFALQICRWRLRRSLRFSKTNQGLVWRTRGMETCPWKFLKISHDILMGFFYAIYFLIDSRGVYCPIKGKMIGFFLPNAVYLVKLMWGNFTVNKSEGSNYTVVYMSPVSPIFHIVSTVYRRFLCRYRDKVYVTFLYVTFWYTS